MNCTMCHGDCQLEDWERDTSFISNNPEKARLKVVHAHARLKPLHIADVARVRAEIRSMPAITTFACSSCGRFAFNEPTVCLWCRRERR